VAFLFSQTCYHSGSFFEEGVNMYRFICLALGFCVLAGAAMFASVAIVGIAQAIIESGPDYPAGQAMATGISAAVSFVFFSTGWLIFREGL